MMNENTSIVNELKMNKASSMEMNYYKKLIRNVYIYIYILFVNIYIVKKS